MTKARCHQEAVLIRGLTARGWRALGRTGCGHMRFRWPVSGAELIAPSKMQSDLRKRVMQKFVRAEAQQTTGVRDA